LSTVTISSVMGREILDSRGGPTVEADVRLSDGSLGRASVPSGASTGSLEAIELRDGDPKRYGGLGVLRAVANVNTELADAIKGHTVTDQRSLDERLVELDGTANKARLGANAILSVSLAYAKAAAASAGESLYAYIGHEYSGPIPRSGYTIPVPMFNIINGGRHAFESTDFQEFMVVPAGFDTYQEALRAGSEIYHALKDMLQEQGKTTIVGDEGGFAPSLKNNRQAVEWLLRAIETAGYRPGEHCFIALDVAASELRRRSGNGLDLASGEVYYDLTSVDTTITSEQLIALYEDWVIKYPVISIEDGMSEDDWSGWTDMTARIGSRVQLVGDDLYATNTGIIKQGIARKASNAVLIKPNQIGTLTETLDAVALTRDTGWRAIISHRSAETEDTSIADLAIGTGARQIKAGAPARSERTAKYNRLLHIEQELGGQATFAGRTAYASTLDSTI
jgi:enolase